MSYNNPESQEEADYYEGHDEQEHLQAESDAGQAIANAEAEQAKEQEKSLSIEEIIKEALNRGAIRR